MKLLLDQSTIRDRVLEVAKEITAHYNNSSLTILGVMKGSFVFMSDLIREIENEKIEIEFINISSYSGKVSGNIKCDRMDFRVFDKKNILIVEDIIETGNTIDYVIKLLQECDTTSIEIVSFLFKHDVYKLKHNVKWSCFDIGHDFVVGYGLDYNGKYRNLRDLYLYNENE